MKKTTLSSAFLVTLLAVSTNTTHLFAQHAERKFDKSAGPVEKKVPTNPCG